MALNLIFPPSSTTVLTPTHHKNHFHFSISSSKPIPNSNFNHFLLKKSKQISPKFFTDHPPKPLNFICRDAINENPNFQEEDTIVLDYTDAKYVDLSSPWEGAVIYKRNASVTHLEYCTTLERLGFGKFSTEVSKSKASIMGLRVTKAVKDYPLGTPVQVSIDVTRRKHKLRLDGVIKSVLTLDCMRCGEPAAKSLFLNLALLLDEQPIEEPDAIDLGDILGKDKSKNYGTDGENENDDDIDMDDRLYFPAELKEIDISKNIRDLVHVEITIDALCDASCRGVCVECGADLNTSSCSCSQQEVVEEKSPGPLRDLKTQMQRK